MIQGIYQIRIHSRGGQGAKTAGQIIAESVIGEGKFAQAFSEYGPERSGAPMKTFLRISNKEIRLHGDVENPDMVIVLDPSLLTSVDVANGLEKDGILIINTSGDVDDIKNKNGFKKNMDIRIINASGIAREIIGKDLPNTPVVGAVAKIVPEFSLKKAEEITKKHFQKKLPKDIIDKNIEALREGYKEV